MPTDLDFETLVNLHYQPLYRFAFSLCRSEADAGDFTQQTFYLWATKGHQLRDTAKVKTWLFTTLHRLFLEKSRRMVRFHHVELDNSEDDLPICEPPQGIRLDGAATLKALGELDEVFRAPVALFYLEDYTYKEIAEVLDIPMGTVKSRIYRGIAQLQSSLQQTRAASTATSEAHE